jgi:hypothetical protein
VLAAEVRSAVDDELQQLISGLDLSAARILRVGWGQVPPQEGVLWLEGGAVSLEWGQLSPGLVVLVARSTLVRMHFHLISGWHVATFQQQAFWLHQLDLALDGAKSLLLLLPYKELSKSESPQHHQASAPICVDDDIRVAHYLHSPPVHRVSLLRTTRFYPPMTKPHCR